MCGIAAVVTSGGPVPASWAEKLFQSIVSRGRDACGAAYFVPGEGWTVRRRVGPVTDRANMKSLVDPIRELEPRAVLLHTRAATHGSPDDNKNNHPVLGRHSIMIHNGVVSVPQRYEAIGKTDSEQLLRHVETVGLTRALKETRGSFAVGLVDLDRADRILLTRNAGSPLHAVDIDGDMVYCSNPLHGERGRRSTQLQAGELHELAVKPGKLELKERHLKLPRLSYSWLDDEKWDEEI